MGVTSTAVGATSAAADVVRANGGPRHFLRTMSNDFLLGLAAVSAVSLGAFYLVARAAFRAAVGRGAGGKQQPQHGAAGVGSGAGGALTQKDLDAAVASALVRERARWADALREERARAAEREIGRAHV